MRAPILLYHLVAPPSTSPPPAHPGNYLSPEVFERQLDWLVERGYRTRTVSELVERWDAGASLRRQVALSFDDAYASFLDHAWPALQRRRMTATVYAVSGELGGSNRWDQADGRRVEALLSADQLRELAAAGIEIGSHGASHADLTTLGAARLEREVSGSKTTLESVLDREVRTFCYPYAHCDAAARAAVERAGYHAAVSVHGWPGTSARDRFALPRLMAPPAASGAELRLLLSAAYPLLRRLPRVGLLSALRRKEDS